MLPLTLRVPSTNVLLPLSIKKPVFLVIPVLPDTPVPTANIVSAVPALSKELAIETADNLYVKENGSYEFDIVGQKSHGVCAIGRDPWDAYEHVERLDHICEIVLKGTLLR